MNQKTLVGWVLALAALNVGLESVLGTNLIESVLGSGVLSQVAYGVIGLVGVYKIYMLTAGKK
ncbi:hypothetical protein A3C59_05360 [Candidatus Daviesbacteria bacterium RIFCSPHIGHO2_02_FULL_36_13]|uniref:DUF378 domain-containing protein n=1 Tax=Candidatus Daviesbacteria bacterium RIFCSPHIGHO2_02_FULL_36_13 TaxID=1797768 RepID=A0A1F5JSE2_9BACT|nr:MAG: hypothetical protein A3C59_05360 [Candidatus Daviesbacteria bacterium RIFCSPHIGHO2_02_FULL_36_13]